jgi:hypothetical protein
MTTKFIFPMHGNIFLLPSWTVNTLHRRGLKAADILNFSRIRPIFSVNDLAGLQVLQKFGDEVVGAKDLAGCSLEYPWSQTCATEEDRKFLKEQLTPLFGDPYHQGVLIERLFSEGDTASSEKPFEVVPLGDDALAVVLYPGAFTPTNAPRQHFNVIRALLKQLYVYEEHTTVAATPLSLRYLELLSLRK